MFAKILGTTLAGTVFATAAFGGGAVLADTTPAASATPALTAPADHTNTVATDALRDVLGRMVQGGILTDRQRDAVVDAVVKADWDGYSLHRLRAILDTVVDKGIITGREADAIVDAVRHSDRTVFRLANVLDALTDKGVLSRDQTAAIVAALHRADWDGFSIARLGRILAELVRHGVISPAQRDAIMDGMRR
jgi:hypothetical protein